MTADRGPLTGHPAGEQPLVECGKRSMPVGRDRLNSPLARPQRLQEPFELPLRAANLFSTGAAFVLRRERPGKKSRPDPPVHAFDAPSRKGRSRRRWLTGTRDASWAARNDRALGGLTFQEAT